MKSRNEEVRRSIEESVQMFQAARRTDIALKIRSKMIEKSLKNVDIAERLGVSEANVSRWLRGNQNLSIDTIHLLADAIEEPLQIIVGDVGNALLKDSNDCVDMSEESSMNSGGGTLRDFEDEDGVPALGNVVQLSDYRLLSQRAYLQHGGPFAEARSGYGIVEPDERIYN